MALNLEEVRRISALARLRLSPEEEQKFVPQLARIVEHIDHLAEYPTAAPSAAGAGGGEAPDEAAPCLPRALVLANAPETYDDFVVVPQVRGGDDA